MMESALWQLLDLMLAGLVLGVGWAAVGSSDLRRGVVLFIAFGMLLALVWARLRAPDLALAEATIGAGLSGALLLAALRDETAAAPGDEIDCRIPAWAVSLLVLLLCVAVAWALIAAAPVAEPVRLAHQVSAHLGQSGVSNPVTAVLLNFRAYDTLLELAVLLAAVLGVVSVGPARPRYRAAGPLLQALIRWQLPLLILTAGYLLWVGSHAPGGAFQAGAMLAAAGVMLRLSGSPSAGLPSPALLRSVLVVGIAVFLGVGLVLTVGGRAFLQYPEAWSGGLILLIESAATLSIAATLVLAYVGGWPQGRESMPLPPSTTKREEIE